MTPIYLYYLDKPHSPNFTYFPSYSHGPILQLLHHNFKSPDYPFLPQLPHLLIPFTTFTPNHPQFYPNYPHYLKYSHNPILKITQITQFTTCLVALKVFLHINQTRIGVDSSNRAPVFPYFPYIDYQKFRRFLFRTNFCTKL